MTDELCLNGFSVVTENEMKEIDGGSISFVEVCHVIVVAAGCVVGGAIGSPSVIGIAAGGIAGSAVAEIAWQAVMGD